MGARTPQIHHFKLNLCCIHVSTTLNDFPQFQRESHTICVHVSSTTPVLSHQVHSPSHQQWCCLPTTLMILSLSTTLPPFVFLLLSAVVSQISGPSVSLLFTSPLLTVLPFASPSNGTCQFLSAFPIPHSLISGDPATPSALTEPL